MQSSNYMNLSGENSAHQTDQFEGQSITVPNSPTQNMQLAKDAKTATQNSFDKLIKGQQSGSLDYMRTRDQSFDYLGDVKTGDGTQPFQSSRSNIENAESDVPLNTNKKEFFRAYASHLRV